jgi:hypothetical protein
VSKEEEPTQEETLPKETRWETYPSRSLLPHQADYLRYGPERIQRIHQEDESASSRRIFLIRRPVSRSASPPICISSVLVADICNKAMYVPVSLTLPKGEKIIEVKALIDCGAGDTFIDKNFV